MTLKHVLAFIVALNFNLLWAKEQVINSDLDETIRVANNEK